MGCVVTYGMLFTYTEEDELDEELDELEDDKLLDELDEELDELDDDELLDELDEETEGEGS